MTSPLLDKSYKIPKDVFARDFALRYAASNPDVAKFFGTDVAAITEHYYTYGIAEGRQLDSFDPVAYANSHPGIASNLGGNEAAISAYYILHDIGSFDSTFDVNAYASRYSDIAAAFGHNTTAITQHYFQYGLAEGRDATFNSSAAHQEIIAGNGNDIINVNHDYDTVVGGAGNDTIYSSSSHNVIFGGTGNDTIIQTGRESVTIIGGDGNDRISGFINSHVEGGDGNDVIEAGSYTLFGGRGITVSGDNLIYGGAGEDTITSGRNDTIYGGDGNDTIRLGDGASTDGGAGNDTILGFGNGGIGLALSGGAGDDFLDITPGLGNGGRGITDDFLDGGAGNDTIHGGLGNDRLIGGEGADVFVFNFVADYNSSALFPGAVRPADQAPDFTSTIDDFNANEDRIQLGDIFIDLGDAGNGNRLIGTRAVTADDAQWILDHAQQQSNGTLLHMPGFDNSTVFLNNVQLTQLSLSNFGFVPRVPAVTFDQSEANHALVNGSDADTQESARITLQPTAGDSTFTITLVGVDSHEFGSIHWATV